MLTQPKALTDAETIASTPSDAAWDENVIWHSQPVAELQSVSTSHLSTRLVLTSTPLQGPFARTSAFVAVNSYDELAYIFDDIPIDGLMPPYSDDDGGIIRPHFCAMS
jgi:hypothetical protein